MGWMERVCTTNCQVTTDAQLAQHQIISANKKNASACSMHRTQQAQCQQLGLLKTRKNRQERSDELYNNVKVNSRVYELPKRAVRLNRVVTALVRLRFHVVGVLSPLISTQLRGWLVALVTPLITAAAHCDCLSQEARQAAMLVVDPVLVRSAPMPVAFWLIQKVYAPDTSAKPLLLSSPELLTLAPVVLSPGITALKAITSLRVHRGGESSSAVVGRQRGRKAAGRER